MQIIPLAAVPNQSIDNILDGQSCTIVISTKAEGALYCDLYIDNELIIGGVICENRNRIVRNAYLGFVGDLAFVDLQGSENPVYAGLGTRYFLVYLEFADLVDLGFAAAA